jgi:thiamine-phosphate pyrophosphorylase
MRRRRRLEAAVLYVVTGARRRQGDLAHFLDAVLSGGADVIQLREKDAEARQLLEAGECFGEAAQRHGALFIVNDRPDVARALDADGVHLGQDDVPVGIAREILGADALIGLSTHTAEQFADAHQDADYLCAGPIFATPTKPGRPATGIELIRSAAVRAQHGDERRPWFAIGGLDATTLPDVIAAGARRAVVVRAADTADPRAGVARLRALFTAS